MLTVIKKHRTMITTMALFVLIVVLAIIPMGGDSPTTSVSVVDVYKMLKENPSAILLDVRTPGEFYGPGGHVEGAILIPVQELEQRVDELEPYRDKTILTFCRTGRRSGIAAEFLSKKGFTVLNVEGGIVKWSEANLPTVKGNVQ